MARCPSPGVQPQRVGQAAVLMVRVDSRGAVSEMYQPEHGASKLLQFFFAEVDADLFYCAYSATDLLPLIDKHADELVWTGTSVAIDWISEKLSA